MKHAYLTFKNNKGSRIGMVETDDGYKDIYLIEGNGRNVVDISDVIWDVNLLGRDFLDTYRIYELYRISGVISKNKYIEVAEDTVTFKFPLGDKVLTESIEIN